MVNGYGVYSGVEENRIDEVATTPTPVLLGAVVTKNITKISGAGALITGGALAILGLSKLFGGGQEQQAAAPVIQEPEMGPTTQTQDLLFRTAARVKLLADKRARLRGEQDIVTDITPTISPEIDIDAGGDVTYTGPVTHTTTTTTTIQEQGISQQTFAGGRRHNVSHVSHC